MVELFYICCFVIESFTTIIDLSIYCRKYCLILSISYLTAIGTYTFFHCLTSLFTTGLDLFNNEKDMKRKQVYFSTFHIYTSTTVFFFFFTYIRNF